MHIPCACRVEFLAAEDNDDSVSVSSADNVGIKQEHEIMESANSSDADDEHCSQTSTSPGITLTPDLKSGPFKYPISTSSKISKSQIDADSATVSVKSEKENDDGFFSGFDVEDMEV